MHEVHLRNLDLNLLIPLRALLEETAYKAGGARRFTLKQYLQFPHALVETLAGQQTLVDRPLAQLGVKRPIVLSIPFFVPAIYAIAQSDLVLTVPRRLAKLTAGMAGVKVVEPPREIKAFPYFMAWHPRLTGEPAHAWFREQIRLVARTA